MTYTVVDDTSGKNPKNEGWYEESEGVYTLTTDTSPVENKTYYTKETYTVVGDTSGKNPKNEGWYEESEGVYTLTTDTSPVENKTYYTKN